ncbi:MAG: FecR domain-containing protein [Chitinophagaceae bacterium]
MNSEKLFELLKKYDEGQCTAQELNELEAWYTALDKKQVGFLVPPGSEQAATITRQKLAELKARLHIAVEPEQATTVVGHIPWRRISVAASITLLLGLGAWFTTLSLSNSRIKNPAIIAQHTGTDALPGANKASLTLADGRIIILDSAAVGKLAEQGGSDVLNQGNGIAYTGSDGAAEIVYNTLATNRGEQYSLTLSDGTRAWLNAASSIRYPVAFIGNERKVEITGEVYFEVAPSIVNTSSGRGDIVSEAKQKRPFMVQKGDMQVTVLGTHFNVNAYDDETDIKVTLLEGSVRVQVPSLRERGLRGEAIIKPGQQATVIPGPDPESIKVINNADIDQTMAWKNGRFHFTGADIQTVMRQLGRWYDMEIIYEGKPPADKFGGMISRNMNLSNVLKILNLSGIKYKIEGKKLIITT